MEIIRGKHAGRTVTLMQFSNDWISADLDGQPLVLKPTFVKLADEERAVVVATIDNPRVGTFWDEWDLNDDGTFTALRPRPDRRRRGRSGSNSGI